MTSLNEYPAQKIVKIMSSQKFSLAFHIESDLCLRGEDALNFLFPVLAWKEEASTSNGITSNWKLENGVPLNGKTWITLNGVTSNRET